MNNRPILITSVNKTKLIDLIFDKLANAIDGFTIEKVMDSTLSNFGQWTFSIYVQINYINLQSVINDKSIQERKDNCNCYSMAINYWREYVEKNWRQGRKYLSKTQIQRIDELILDEWF